MRIEHAAAMARRISQLWQKTTPAQIDVITDALKRDEFEPAQVEEIIAQLYVEDSAFFELSTLVDRVKALMPAPPRTDPAKDPEHVKRVQALSIEKFLQRELDQRGEQIAAMSEREQHRMFEEFLKEFRASLVKSAKGKPIAAEELDKLVASQRALVFVGRFTRSFLLWAMNQPSPVGANNSP